MASCTCSTAPDLRARGAPADQSCISCQYVFQPHDAMRGRKPIPTAQKILMGNPGKRPLPEREPQIPATRAEILVEPPELAGDDAAIAEWRRLASKIVDAGILTDGDRGAFVLYCQEWSRAQRAQAALLAGGEVVRGRDKDRVKNPWSTIRRAAIIEVRRLAAELGLTPASRPRVTRDDNPLTYRDDVFKQFDDDAADSAAH